MASCRHIIAPVNLAKLLLIFCPAKGRRLSQLKHNTYQLRIITVDSISD